MRIMPIMNNQISYKGTMVFQDDVMTSNPEGKGIRQAKFAMFDSTKIESVSSADNFTYLNKKSAKDYKTIIKMDSGDFFLVKPDPKVVSEIKLIGDMDMYKDRRFFFAKDEYSYYDENCTKFE